MYSCCNCAAGLQPLQRLSVDNSHHTTARHQSVHSSSASTAKYLSLPSLSLLSLPAMTTSSPAPRRPLLPPSMPSTPSSKLTIPSVRLSLCVPPSSVTGPATGSSPHPTSASSTSVLQSFMAKRSHSRFWQARKEWKLRWVVLDRSAHQLRVYADSECLRHPELKPRSAYSTAGMECLPKGNENRPDDDFDGRARWSFDLILKEAGKKMELGCDTAEKRQEWLDFIAAAKHDDADKENTAAGGSKQDSKASSKEQQQQQQQQQQKQHAASPASLSSPSSSAAAVSLMSPPRPPKRPLMGTPFAAPAIAPAADIAAAADGKQQHDELRMANHEPHGEESKQQLLAPPSSPEIVAQSAYLSKAIATGIAIPLLPTRPQQAASEAESAAKKPALPASAPRNTAARPTPTQPPPPLPAQPHSDHHASAGTYAEEDDSGSVEDADDLSTATSPQSPLASMLVAHHAALLSSSGGVGSAAWNEEWQLSLSKARNASSSISSVLHSKHVYELHRQFLASSEKWARRVVEEYCLPSSMRTVKPVVEGVEREKQVFLMEGIGFQLAQAGDEDEDDYLSQQSQSGQQSGEDGSAPEMSLSAARLADQLGSKKATHELHTLTALHAANLPSSVCLPLMATVDYLGFRVKATATLPIYDESALVWGRDSRGQHKQTAAATDVLNELAASLHLRPHAVDGQGVPLSSSVRVYRSGERYYVTELNSVAPVDVDVQYAMTHGRLQQGWPAKVFRHEYIAHCSPQLQSDVYAGTDRRLRERQAAPVGEDDRQDSEADDDDDEDADEEEAEARAADASRTLQHTMIPRFIKAQEYMAGGQMADIPAVPQSLLQQQPARAPDSAFEQPTAASTVNVWPCVGGSWLNVLVDGSDLCRAMHAHGINLRYLGRVAELSRQSHLRQLSAVEMVARTVKALLNQNLRTVHRKVVNTEAARQQTADTALAPHCLLLLQHSLLERHRDGVVELMNLALGKGDDSDQFWTLLLYPDIRIKYALTAESPITLSYLRQLHLPTLFSSLQQRCGVCFVDREYAFGSERPIANHDFVAFTAHVKHAQPVLAADRHNSKARRACSSQPVDKVEAKDWQRLCTALDMQLTIRGWKPTDSQQQLPQDGAVEVGEGRLRLRLLNELINAQLQCGNLDKADSLIAEAQQLSTQLIYPAGFSSLPAAACAASVAPPLTSFGSHAENGRLQINRMWSGILRVRREMREQQSTPGPHSDTSGLVADIRRSLTEQYQNGVSMLNYHVGLLHPLMLALHFALATFHIQLATEVSQAADGHVAVNLLTHCHQFARALFGSAKPLTWQLALTLSHLLAQQRDYNGTVRWLNTAAEGMKKAVDADKKSKGAEAEEERQKLKERRAAVLANISEINDRQQREKEEKTQ